jgi:hypothetical protein
MIDKTNELMDYIEVNKIVSECQEWQGSHEFNQNHDENKKEKKNCV